MAARIFLTLTLVFVATQPLWGQSLASQWRAAGGATPADAQGPVIPATANMPTEPPPSPTLAPPLAPEAPSPRRSITRVTNGSGSLPNERGQVWREYDISPYTTRVTSTRRPEQAVVDWILRETGYEVWHSEPLGILSATPRTLRVYHTPEMQALVADVVDRFVASEAQTETFCLRVMTIDSPNWRVRALRALRPVPVQTQGASAWLLQKEDAAVLLADWQRRSDYREHSSPHLMVNNGQSTVVSMLRPRTYVHDVILRPETACGFENRVAQIDEGFSLEFSPLLTLDGRMIDAAIKCNIDQVEKMTPVTLEVPTAALTRERARIDAPQMSHVRFHERFRWPTEQVLLISLGVVATPQPVDVKAMVAGLPLPLPSSPPRADLLLMIESKSTLAAAAPAGRCPEFEAKTYRDRY